MDPVSVLDHPDVSRVLFHPRKQSPALPPEGARDLIFTAYDGTLLGGRLFEAAGTHAPTILFFHGNGEIAEDYDDIASLFNDRGINLVVADYRGYGASRGIPTVSDMLRDAHAIFGEVQRLLAKENRNPELWIMGRSLGSASALEIASNCENGVAGLIIESGFSRTAPLLRVLGLNAARLGMADEADPLDHTGKIARFGKRTLIIHSEYDEIISLAQGEELYEASKAARKRFFLVRGAGHNDIFFADPAGYMEAVREIIAGP